MSDRETDLRELTRKFFDAFNRQDLDAVVESFAPDATFQDHTGALHSGHDAIRAVFSPLVNGDRGKIRFEDDDFLADTSSDRVATSWSLEMDVEGKRVKIRGSTC